MEMTSVDLPAGLVEQAMRVTGATTERGAITSALEQVVARAEQHRAIDAIIGMESLGDLLEPGIRLRARR
ncbi:hypothetical protein Sked_04380 [Sanguibacter keddieii DSM 10542]|uniref:DUF2191 domain-containing protein n=1 Tax=Sanguibacter keddieii (strain ATCC 51767 / DSM 10542 / NCFB 3025 / ST-74) TaxID=446469 RepID=D1BKC7_SANKS|nr:type II toxin-antitoxin system VapB family antitoxin [Sanguibacter keddieii]ACZ20404.1 hypothetical protein Sked_04380 [Sanguibacter keddieii DSM 10542]